MPCAASCDSSRNGLPVSSSTRTRSRGGELAGGLVLLHGGLRAAAGRPASTSRAQVLGQGAHGARVVAEFLASAASTAGGDRGHGTCHDCRFVRQSYDPAEREGKPMTRSTAPTAISASATSSRRSATQVRRFAARADRAARRGDRPQQRVSARPLARARRAGPARHHRARALGRRRPRLPRARHRHGGDLARLGRGRPVLRRALEPVREPAAPQRHATRSASATCRSW